MKTRNTQLINQAIDDLRGNLWVSVGAFLVATIALQASSFGLGIGYLLLFGPIMVGMYSFALTVVREHRKMEFDEIFVGFQNFGKNIVRGLAYLGLLMLGLILFVIPGIYFGLSSMFIWFVFAENPDMEFMDAYRRSRELMEGNYLKAIGLMILFFLLMLTTVLTLFIGMLFLLPVVYYTYARFYEEAKQTVPVREYVPVTEDILRRE